MWTRRKLVNGHQTLAPEQTCRGKNTGTPPTYNCTRISWQCKHQAPVLVILNMTICLPYCYHIFYSKGSLNNEPIRIHTHKTILKLYVFLIIHHKFYSSGSLNNWFWKHWKFTPPHHPTPTPHTNSLCYRPF